MRIRQENDPETGYPRLAVTEGEVSFLVAVSHETARDALMVASELWRHWFQFVNKPGSDPDALAAEMLRRRAAEIDGRDVETELEEARDRVAMLEKLAHACGVDTETEVAP